MPWRSSCLTCLSHADVCLSRIWHNGLCSYCSLALPALFLHVLAVILSRLLPHAFTCVTKCDWLQDPVLDGSLNALETVLACSTGAAAESARNFGQAASAVATGKSTQVISNDLLPMMCCWAAQISSVQMPLQGHMGSMRQLAYVQACAQAAQPLSHLHLKLDCFVCMMYPQDRSACITSQHIL